MAVIAIADVYGIEGRRDELAALLGRFEAQAAAQPGCRELTVYSTEGAVRPVDSRPMDPRDAD